MSEHMKDEAAVPFENTSGSNFTIWINNHKEAFHRALFHLNQNRFATIITLLVIASTLTLPAMFQIFSSNLQGKESRIAQHSGLSVFLKPNVSPANVQRLINQIKSRPEVKKVDYITPKQAMQEFQQSIGLSKEQLLQSNPLPAVIYVTPKLGEYNTKNVEQLKDIISASSDVDQIQVDIDWISKLLAIIGLVKNFVGLLALFLIFTILIIVGNTIRLLAQHYYDEIMISKLFGATDAYVRRPFLYSGLLFGFLGGFFACVFVLLGLLWLYPNISQVIQAYGSQIAFSGLSLLDIFTILAIGSLLGIGGAWIASNRIINEISL